MPVSSLHLNVRQPVHYAKPLSAKTNPRFRGEPTPPPNAPVIELTAPNGRAYKAFAVLLPETLKPHFSINATGSFSTLYQLDLTKQRAYVAIPVTTKGSNTLAPKAPILVLNPANDGLLVVLEQNNQTPQLALDLLKTHQQNPINQNGLTGTEQQLLKKATLYLKDNLTTA